MNEQDNLTAPETTPETFVIAEEPSASEATERGFLYNTVYSACYYLSFGLVFPTAFVARVLPTPPIVRHGLHDGAAAARGSVERVRHSTGRAVATAAQKYGETVEGIQDRMAERKYRRQQARLPAPGTA